MFTKCKACQHTIFILYYPRQTETFAFGCPDCKASNAVEIKVKTGLEDCPRLDWDGLQKRYEESISDTNLEHGELEHAEDTDNEGFGNVSSNWFAYENVHHPEDDLTECIIRRGDDKYIRMGRPTSVTSTQTMFYLPAPNSTPKARKDMGRNKWCKPHKLTRKRRKNVC